MDLKLEFYSLYIVDFSMISSLCTLENILHKYMIYIRSYNLSSIRQKMGLADKSVKLFQMFHVHVYLFLHTLDYLLVQLHV